MSALPKNKITRVERGKRRRGNTPQLRKDIHSSVPLHKQGLVAQLFKFMGLDLTQSAATLAKEKSDKSSKKAKRASGVSAPKSGVSQNMAKMGSQSAKQARSTNPAQNLAKKTAPRKMMDK